MAVITLDDIRHYLCDCRQFRRIVDSYCIFCHGLSLSIVVVAYWASSVPALPADRATPGFGLLPDSVGPERIESEGDIKPHLFVDLALELPDV